MNQNHSRFPLREMALFDAFLVGLFILSTRLAVFIHEVLGHAAHAWLTGGHVEAILISLLGGGKVVGHPGCQDLFYMFCFSFSGIFLNLVFGVAALAHVYASSSESKAGIWDFFWFCFATASILGTLAYLVTGLYHAYGDPAGWIKVSPQKLVPWSVVFLLPLPVAAHLCTTAYLGLQEQLFPSRTKKSRLGKTCLLLGISCLIYAFLFYFSGQSIASLDAPRMARGAAKRFPMVWAVAAFYLGGGLYALARFDGKKTRPAALNLQKKDAALALVLAWALLTALLLARGAVYPLPCL